MPYLVITAKLRYVTGYLEWTEEENDLDVLISDGQKFSKQNLWSENKINKMLGIIIDCKSKEEVGPTYVGDSESDPDLMSFLCAKKIREPCNNFDVFKTDFSVRKVLDLLETKGWSVVGSMAMDHQCIWTLHQNL